MTLKSESECSEMIDLLLNESRIHMILPEDNIKGISGLKELALDAGRPRGDLWENCIWKESISVNKNEMYLFQAIHQEADVVPENIDAIRAIMGELDRENSMELTDLKLGIGEL